MIGTPSFVIRFLGEEIACSSPRDAAALQRASDILTDLAPGNVSSDERAELTVALLRYERYRAACQLRLLKLRAL